MDTLTAQMPCGMDTPQNLMKPLLGRISLLPRSVCSQSRRTVCSAAPLSQCCAKLIMRHISDVIKTISNPTRHGFAFVPCGACRLLFNIELRGTGDHTRSRNDASTSLPLLLSRFWGWRLADDVAYFLLRAALRAWHRTHKSKTKFIVLTCSSFETESLSIMHNALAYLII